MDENVVRTVNEGPMGPQGPVKVNHCIMNNKAGYRPVVRLFNLENIQYEGDDTITGGGTGGDTVTGGGTGGDSVSGGGTGGDSVSGGTTDAGAGEDTVSGGGTDIDPDTPGSGMFDNPTINPGDGPNA